MTSDDLSLPIFLMFVVTITMLFAIALLIDQVRKSAEKTQSNLNRIELELQRNRWNSKERT
jgi:hypothetical protein